MHDGNLLISGTASIVGSETVFVGDIEKQTVQTLENVSTLIRESGVTPSLTYFTYVKYEQDVPLVQQILENAMIRSSIRVLDICREDLLVEIEAYSTNLL